MILAAICNIWLKKMTTKATLPSVAHLQNVNKISALTLYNSGALHSASVCKSKLNFTFFPALLWRELKSCQTHNIKILPNICAKRQKREKLCSKCSNVTQITNFLYHATSNSNFQNSNNFSRLCSLRFLSDGIFISLFSVSLHK